jgi:hypothetical protein
VEIALLLLRKYWPFVVGVLLLVALGCWHTNAIHKADAAGYARAQIELKAEQLAERDRTDKVRRENELAYKNRIDSLESRVSELRAVGTPIRMCTPTIKVQLPEATGVDDGGPADGQGEGIGSDLRPRLVDYAASCESLRVQVNSLVDFINGIGR